MTTIPARFEWRNDIAANWVTNNRTPLLGEPCYESDTGKLKVGDGATPWNSLAYFVGSGVTSFNTRTGAVTLLSADIIAALGYTPESIYQNQNSAVVKSAATTLTAAEIAGKLIEYNGVAANLTMPTGANLDSTLTGIINNTAVDFSVINTGSGTATILMNTGITIIGAVGVVVGASGFFRLHKTGTASYTLYRIA